MAKDMDIDQLECHLIELQEKGLNTRGVVRHLIRLHTNNGNTKRVSELQELLKSKGHAESPGMKSSLLHSYVQSGNLHEAIKTYRTLRDECPEFHLDNYKIIDLAKLLIQNNRFEEAKQILNEHASTLSGGKELQRNCIELLNSCSDKAQLDWCYKFLIHNKSCEYNIHTLAPLLQYHLEKGSVEEAVKTYVECASKFKCSPQQSEVFSAVLKTGNEKLLGEIVKALQIVHGNTICQFVLATSMAECGLRKPLKKLLAQNNIPINNLMMKKCQKWVQERNLDALKTLAQASHKLPPKIVDEVYVNKCIMQVFVENGQFEEATRFLELVVDEKLSFELERDFQKMLKKTKLSNFGK